MQADAPARARVGSAGPRRELDVSACSYRAGLERIRPRADRFAAAVRATLAAGASAAEVQAILAEAGLSLAELPAALADEIDAAGEPRPGPDV